MLRNGATNIIFDGRMKGANPCFVYPDVKITVYDVFEARSYLSAIKPHTDTLSHESKEETVFALARIRRLYKDGAFNDWTDFDRAEREALVFFS
jgi:hypothetical protein